MKKLATFAMVVLSASVSAAQGTKAPAAPDSSKTKSAPSAAKAPDSKQTTKAADTKQPVAGTKVGDTKQTVAGTKAGDTKQQATAPVTKAPETKAPAAAPALNAAQQAQLRTPTIMREVYSYSTEGRRDPFVSLLSSSDLRPTVGDLRLTSILYDENGSNSIAMMRDLVDDTQYRVVTGQTLGRMRVALIKRKVVIFTIEEFGQNRQDSLVLGDTTKARAK